MGAPVEEEKLRKPFSHTDGKSLLGRHSLTLPELPFFPAGRAEGTMFLAEMQRLLHVPELSGLAFVPATTSVGNK